MKTLRFCPVGCQFLLISLIIFTSARRAGAQNTGPGTTVPVVTIQATDPVASGPGNPGVFTVFRAGNTNLTLNVFYQIGGTASNGVDYLPISNWVTIPAGATSNSIVITPLATTTTAANAARTVVLQLTPSPVMSPLISYGIGVPSNAVVYVTSPASNTVPVVTIQATDPIASGSGNPGVFTVFRAGNPNLTLNVFYQIGGTASNGVDYLPISNWVTIPAGATSNSITITPLKTAASSVTKTVVLQLAWSPLLIPINYEIGVPSNAVVYLASGGGTNRPPVVSLLKPNNGDVFYTPTNVQILARATDPDGSVTNVEFFAGLTDLGPGSPVVLDPPGVNGVTGLVYLFNWLNVPPGNYPLTAVAADNAGALTTSVPVNISVRPGPRTNLPPVVAISSPTNGQKFAAPASIFILAPAYDPDGVVKAVAFFADGNSLGVFTNPPPPPPGSAMPVLVPQLLWTNVPAGNYALTAVATDDGGLSATSAPVTIAVITGPPPTNRPPVVRMVSPANGSVFHAPVNLPLYAYASDPDGSVASVEFFADSNTLGFGRSVPVATPLGGGVIIVGGPLPPVYPTNIFVLVWSNAPAGTYALTAQATDNVGASTVSDPVKIAILPPPPPPTNRPVVVSIAATDPVAIEGTNFWVWPGETNPTPTWAAWPTAVCRFFTNCGPKTATFTVRRMGDTNGDLTVTYGIGGTASNGVDYVALPGAVTIPAGQRRALITLVPIDDGPPDVNKTVILALTPSTNTPPDYVIGFPPRAAAVIIDGDRPRPVTGIFPDKCFHLVTSGPDAAWFCIQYSTDLAHWTPVCTNQVINGSIDFVDPDAAGSPSRFYRALPLSGAPAD